MPYAFLEIRPAVRNDFTAIDNSKKIGTPYFCKNKDGIIESKINYLTENTDMKTFKKLYNNQQIFVMKDTLQAIAIEENLD